MKLISPTNSNFRIENRMTKFCVNESVGRNFRVVTWVLPMNSMDHSLWSIDYGGFENSSFFWVLRT